MAEANFLRQITIERSSKSTTGAEGTQELRLNSKPKDCIIAGWSYLINLYEIVYANEMYSPAHLTVKCHITKTDQKQPLPSYQDIVDFFLLKKVQIQLSKEFVQPKDVEIVQSNNSDLLDTNYYVHEVRPSFENRKKIGDIVILYLDIYSADKLMTLDKYSKSYVHKSLYNDILSKEVNIINKSIDISIETQDYSSRLKYGNEKKEIVHPYLVQYNEPLYDFLARTANRMGEFLYFAHGKLTLGVKADATATEIKNYTSLAVESCNNSVLSVKGISRKYSSKVHDRSSKDLRYTQPTSNDDYLAVYEKDKFDSLGLELKPYERYLPTVFKSLFTKSTFGALLADLFITQGKDVGFSALYANTVNNKYNKSAIDEVPGKANEKIAVLSGTYRGDTEYIIDDWYVNANADFYNEIDACEKKMASRSITIKINSEEDRHNYQVGEIIKVMSSKYVVTNVKYSEIFDGVNTKHEFILCALPLLVVEIETGTRKVSLRLIDENKNTNPNSKTTTICCPTALPEERRIRKAAPQIAWVVDSDDPKYQGRVRIRYAWDENKDLKKEASPWIRQAEPAAGKGGGLSFRLYKDDEVMIGYENDNIEQPFVIGALYHEDEKDKDGNTIKNGAPVGRNKLIQITHQLSNRSGHKIVLSETNTNAPFWTGFQPALSLINNLYTAISGGSDDEPGSPLAGGIQFTDKYGIYNVSMSTDQRLITIASPMGNISMSAFTGITISAPRGDISITGKNVSIKAANKLTLESGSNAKNTEFDKRWHDEKYGSAIWYGVADTAYQGFVGGFSNFISSLTDLSLLRHTVECFIAPVDGTLQIKSNRYLLLEAGKGKANIPQKGFQDTVPTNEKDQGNYNKYYGGSNTVVKMKEHIKLLAGMVDELKNNYIPILEKVHNTAVKYNSHISCLHPIDRRSSFKVEDEAFRAIKGIVEKDKFDPKVIFKGYVNQRQATRAISHATAYWEAIKALDKFVKSNYIDEKECHWWKDMELGKAFTEANKKIHSIFGNTIKVPNSVNDIPGIIRDYNNIVMPKLPRWQVIYAYLTALTAKNNVAILESKKGLPNTTMPKEYDDVTDFLNDLQIHTPSGLGAERLVGELLQDNFIKNTKKNIDFWSTKSENNNWGYDRAKYGRILFSDQDENTYYVDSGKRDIVSNPNPNIGEIRKLVNDIFKEEKEIEVNAVVKSFVDEIFNI